jgi:hypothetical protein
MKQRHVTVQLEIVELWEGSTWLKLIIDGNYESTAFSDARMYRGSPLFSQLSQILQKYQPRGTIDSSIASQEIEKYQDQSSP